MRLLSAFLLIIGSFGVPLSIHADFLAPPLNHATFENLQNLAVTVQESSASGANETLLSDQGAFTLPIGIPLNYSYSINHGALWPSRNATPAAQDQLFNETLSEDDLYMELWEGVPFTPTAHMLQNWDSTGSSTGQVSATLPTPGPYFLIAYFPDGFYQNLQSACPNDPDWQIDCAAPYTLDQMRDYFSSSLTSTSSEPFPYLPDAFGGIQFTVSAATSTPTIGSSNVLFIPGTLTSRLYMKNFDGSERDLWEPGSDLDIPLLAMNTDGTSEQSIYTRDIIDQMYSDNPFYHGAMHAALGKDTDVYGTFETFMDGLVADHTIKEWRAYPYDWRYDVRDIVTDGTLVGTATTSPTRVRLQDVVQELASSSPTGKVTIIAHSNGGLIAKGLAIDLANKNELGLIDKIILVGVPQFGTPKSITDLLHGDEFTQIGGLLMYSDTVRDTEATLPGAYDLIPSPDYFSHISDPVASFDTLQPAAQFRNAIGAIINSFSQLSDFLTDTFHLDGGAGLLGSTKTPIPLSSLLIAKARATHDALDAWIPPAGVSLTTIVGSGNLTPYEETYTGTNGLNCDRTSFFVPIACSLLPQLEPVELFSTAGDDTVVAESAIGNSANSFYMNVKKLSSDTGSYIGHSSLLAASPMQSSLKDILTDKPIDSPYLSDTIPSNTLGPLTVVSAHSPVNLLATDDAGNETGVIPVPQLSGIYFEKEDIPGSSIDVIGEEKYLYLPQNENYRISMTGYASGTTTIDIAEMDSEGSTTITHEFADIPTTASTSATFTVEADGSVTSDTPEFEDVAPAEPPVATTTDSHVPIYVSAESSEKPLKNENVPNTSSETSLFQFVERTVQPVTRIPELIQAFITITNSKTSWTMYSTVFISLFRIL
jgi:pimeloyl-ACP methyl ester carboxylesterase